MKAMTLLRAMSELPPEMLEAAMNAGAQDEPSAESGAAVPVTQNTGKGGVFYQANEAHPKEYSKIFRISGILAAAACLVLMLGVMLHFRQENDSGLVMMSNVSEDIAEITMTEPPQTTAYTTADLAVTPTETVHTTTGMPDTAETAGGTATEAAEETAAAQTETIAETTEPEHTETGTVTTTAVTYAENVPVLVAMGDGAGMLAEESVWETVTDKAAIDAYLNGSEPVVTLGTGQKSNDITEEIMNDCTMLRIRWEMGNCAWSSYGITGAELDENGVLHLQIAMYADLSQMTIQETWIYETALLYQTGTLPDITDVKLELTRYEDTEGIEQWLAYTQVLQEDVCIHTTQ
jgi:hypothetical protein